MESFDSEEEAEEKSEKWARKTFFYLCDEGIIDQESDNTKTKVNINAITIGRISIIIFSLKDINVAL